MTTTNETTGTKQPEFDLQAFKDKRDAAQKAGMRWQATVFEITQAYAEGERNFNRANLDGANLDGANLDGANLDGANLIRANLIRANLYGANLDGANLDGANLDGANLIRANLDGANLIRANLYGANLDGANLDGANGIYMAYAPNLSSRGAALTGGVIVEDGKIQLRFWAGCKQCVTAAKLLEYVKETHDDNIHAKQYRAAIKFIQACFKADIAESKFDYLLTWKPAETPKAEA